MLPLSGNGKERGKSGRQMGGVINLIQDVMGIRTRGRERSQGVCSAAGTQTPQRDGGGKQRLKDRREFAVRSDPNKTKYLLPRPQFSLFLTLNYEGHIQESQGRKHGDFSVHNNGVLYAGSVSGRKLRQ